MIECNLVKGEKQINYVVVATITFIIIIIKQLS